MRRHLPGVRRMRMRCLARLVGIPLALLLASAVYLSQRLSAAAHHLPSSALDLSAEEEAPSGGLAYLDVARLQELWGLPPCDRSEPNSEAMRVKAMAGARFSHYQQPHTLDQHSGPWYFGQSVESSPYLVSSIAQASLVYVDYSCWFDWYWWSRYLNSEERQTLKHDPERVLLNIIERLPEVVPPEKAIVYWPTPYLPDCRRFPWLGQAVNVVAEPVSCAPPRRTIVAPYNANEDAPSEEEGVAFEGRQTLLAYVGGAAAEEGRSAGERMRHSIANIIRGEPDVFVHLGCLGCAGQMMPHGEAVRRLQDSVFCLVLPGDSQSSRRATEVILHGCIPVFVGPPFNVAPLSSVISSYSDFSIVIRVLDTTAWVSTETHAWQEAAWASELGETHVVPDASWVLPTLRSIPFDSVRSMQGALQAARRAFLFRTRLHAAEPTAVDWLLAQMYPPHQAAMAAAAAEAAAATA